MPFLGGELGGGAEDVGGALIGLPCVEAGILPLAELKGQTGVHDHAAQILGGQHGGTNGGSIELLKHGGIEFRAALGNMITIVFTATLASIGTAGVPGAGMVMLAMVLQSVNIPIEGIALVAGCSARNTVTKCGTCP